MITGRPTKYSDDLIPLAEDYLENHIDYGDVVPMVVGLCKVIERSQSTIYNWAKDDDKPAFLDILKRIEEKQHAVLVNKGLTGEFTSPITKMMMTKHGYSDKQEIEVSEKDVTPWGSVKAGVDE
jgi:serine protease inhibitor